MRKKPKDEPIDVDDYDAGGGALHTDDTGERGSAPEVVAARESSVLILFPGPQT